jgi:hypothetical protein
LSEPKLRRYPVSGTGFKKKIRLSIDLQFQKVTLTNALFETWFCFNPPALLVLAVSEATFPTKKYVILICYAHGTGIAYGVIQYGGATASTVSNYFQ